MRRLARNSIIAVIMSIFMFSWLIGCGQGQGDDEYAPTGPGGKADSIDDFVNENKLEKFASAAEFDKFLKTLKDSAPTNNNWGPGGPLYMANTAESTNKSVDSITNNQEAGVDEGDIVKAHGKHLVILRRGRLFSVKLGDASLTPVSYVDAFPAGSKLGTWYDEMLIHGDKIVVVGFSYKVSATEIGLFDIDNQGNITHKNTYFLRSNDYYSSRNYASRLVNGKLVFYMPYFLLRYHWGLSGNSSVETTLPAIHPYPFPQIPEDSNGWLNIIDKTTIYRPVQKVKNPALHTVVTCDLNKPQLSCSAQGIIGPYSRNFYVSKDAVYLWVTKGSGWFFGGNNNNSQDKEQAVVYRLPLNGSNPGAVRAVGNPTDQFSFKAEGSYLNVLVRANGNGDWMWAPEVTTGDVGLVRIPIYAFKSMVKPLNFSRYTTLTTPAKGYIFQNRFVGNYVLYGTGNGWWNAQNDSTIYVANYKYGYGKVTALKLQHSVDRIEAMGKAAVVVGGNKDDLHFTAVELGWYPSLAGSHIEKNAVQGETRSHGFFFKQTSYGNGILGLPVREKGQGWNSLFNGSAKVIYLRVLNNHFAPLGSLDAKPENAVDDKCVVSCVDWYGNARPIFYDGRIFALLGYELVEGQLSWWADTLTETARVDVSSVLLSE